MANIRDDLEGVIYVRDGSEVVQLSAGSEVPDGVEIDDSLVSEAPKRRARTAKAGDDAGNDS